MLIFDKYWALLQKICVGIFLYLCINAILILQLLPEYDDRAYYCRLMSKISLLGEIKSPKIIVVGGSSVWFGQDSRQFEKGVGIPVINFGTHAGFGLEYMLTTIKNNISKGDIVIISPEYTSLTTIYSGQYTLLDLILSCPKAIKYISSIEQTAQIIGAYPMKLKSRLDKHINREYLAISTGGKVKYPSIQKRSWPELGYRGDVSKSPTKRTTSPLRDWENLKTMSLNRKAVFGLIQFREHCNVVKADLYIVYPPIPSEYYEENKEAISRIDSSLKMFFGNEIMNKPEDNALAEKYFYDTIYHLNEGGRKIRTSMLANIIKEKMN